MVHYVRFRLIGVIILRVDAGINFINDDSGYNMFKRNH